VINSKIVFPNKDPFQIENHMLRIHFYVLYIIGRRRYEYSESELFPLILFEKFMEISWKCISSDPIESYKGQMQLRWDQLLEGWGRHKQIVKWGNKTSMGQRLDWKQHRSPLSFLPFCMPFQMQFILV